MKKTAKDYAAEYRAEMKVVADFAADTGRYQYFKKLLHTDLTPQQMRRAIELASPDAAPASEQTVADRYVKRAAPPAVTESAEDQKARAAAEKLWRGISGAPEPTRDFRPAAQVEREELMASVAQQAAVHGRSWHADAIDASLMTQGAEAARKLWSPRASADPRENLMPTPRRKG